MTWFGKPEVAGPISCARNGWVNVDVDLIGCQGCNTMLSFPCPPTWSQHEVDSAAASFSEKLEAGHMSLCPWKGNACSETLAQFPPTPVEVLVDGFQDRCDALYQLLALPALSNTAIDYLKQAKGPQMERFIAQAASSSAVVNGTSEGSFAIAYFQAQRIISLCGWELRLLPYIVDCEDDNAESLRKSAMFMADSKATNSRLVESGPRVLLYSPIKEMVDQNESGPIKTASPEQKLDLGSAVLDCSLCGASVGLWLFSKIPRPSRRTRAEPLMADTDSGACEVSAASEIQNGSCDDQNGFNTNRSGKEDTATSNRLKVESKPANVLTLKLTIAGGPRPTALPQPAGNKVTKTSEKLDVQDVGNKKSSSDIEDGGETGLIVKKRKRNGALEQRGATYQNVRVVPCLSSVNAVDTCFTSRPENSAESVEMPSKYRQTSLTSVENSDSKRQRRPSDEAAEYAISCKDIGIGMSDHKSSPLEGGIEGTTSALLDGSELGSSFCGNRKNSSPVYDTRKSVEPSSRGHGSPTEALHPQEKSSALKKLFDESSREFDPILQHRHFCPWVNTNLGRVGCGWQLTLDALEASPAPAKSESASSIMKANPLSSVRKIFGKS
ncbi:hypothetical protein GOP47_0015289 [Adiantum capillus-veneris]|uniref:C3HC-type domain-containing protein n=1 Tax=Adiantum capillus-veneris TaxID=13818 RepID=A0A9D4UKD7_ADICA|nr:hypothetical protein GOP47_0015289 [Adiantum capillus-veneris]